MSARKRPESETGRVRKGLFSLASGLCITTTPNSLLADVHDRMPVILRDDAYALWLDPEFQQPDAICDLLKPLDRRGCAGSRSARG